MAAPNPVCRPALKVGLDGSTLADHRRQGGCAMPRKKLTFTNDLESAYACQVSFLPYALDVLECARYSDTKTLENFLFFCFFLFG